MPQRGSSVSARFFFFQKENIHLSLKNHECLLETPRRGVFADKLESQIGRVTVEFGSRLLTQDCTLIISDLHALN